MNAPTPQSGLDSPLRLHWTTLVMATLALSALYLSEGQSFVLPLLILALVVSPFAPYRFGKNPAPAWMLRIAVWGLIMALDTMRADTLNNSFFDVKLNWLAEPLAAELVVQAWKRRPEAGARGVALVLLSGLVLLLACDITEEVSPHPHILFLAPAYMLFLILSLRHYRNFPAGQNSPSSPSSPSFSPSSPSSSSSSSVSSFRGRQVAYGIAVGLALGMGMGVHYTFRSLRAELTALGARLLNEQHLVRVIGLSTTPRLTSTYDLQGSPERVLRIEGEVTADHWRALAFSAYHSGGWGPSRNNRRFGPVPTPKPAQGGTGAAPFHLIVSRLTPNNGLLCAPLNAIALDPMDSGDLEYGIEDGGPLFTKTRETSTYSVDVGRDEGAQGLFCAPPDASQRKKLLDTPSDIDPRVQQLAQRIGGNIADPRARAEAVEQYLIANYKYSLTYKPVRDIDPISGFLLYHGAAHCEYFASAATILLRYLGLPARYVVGYYVHESAGPGVTVARQQDAHAWAECWIDGTGWITIDGTPGSGRPDAQAKPVPGWMRVREWIQDTWTRASEWISGQGGMKAAAVVAAGTFLALGWQWRQQARRGGKSRRGEFAYASPDAALTGLAARFERLCRARGLVCPPERTWQEYLASPAARLAAQPAGFDLERASAFTRAYNTARFGAAADRETIDTLQTLLATLEKTASASNRATPDV